MSSRVKIEISAGGVVYQCRDKKPRVVLCRHKTFRNQEVWSLPKGWVEPSEKIEEAALREVKEEAGLEGKILEKIDTIHYWFYHPLEKVKVKKKVHFFLIKAIQGDITKHDFETEEVRWFPVEEAVKFCAYKGEREVLKKAEAKLSLLCKDK